MKFELVEEPWSPTTEEQYFGAVDELWWMTHEQYVWSFECYYFYRLLEMYNWRFPAVAQHSSHERSAMYRTIARTGLVSRLGRHDLVVLHRVYPYSW